MTLEKISWAWLKGLIASKAWLNKFVKAAQRSRFYSRLYFGNNNNNPAVISRIMLLRYNIPMYEP